ncbi:MAG: hypothetical protein ACHQAX_08610 [Gammaproteobacteria bacterium]
MMRSIYAFLALSFLALSAFAKPVIVFDAGSSGTRIYLYDVTEVNGKTNVTTTKYYKPSSATTTYTYPVTDARFAADPVAYFDHFITEIEKTSFDHAATPIYVYATAGVRMATNADAIIADMRKGIRGAVEGDTYPVIADENVNTLTVSQEAFNVWVNDQFVSNALSADVLTADNTFAAVEMGGASAEVSVLVENPADFTDNDVIFAHLGNEYHVYSTGYDGSGQDKAALALLDAYNANPADQRFAGCFPVGAPYPLTAPVLTGTGKFEECSEFIVEHPVNNYDKAPSAERYLLTSGFYYTFKILGLANDATLQTTTNEELAYKGAAFCARTWEDLMEAYPGDTFLITYCFNSAFQHHFLKEMGVKNAASLLSVDKYNGNPMTWTLGVAYTQGN